MDQDLKHRHRAKMRNTVMIVLAVILIVLNILIYFW